ncbi:MAG: ATP-binding protein [Anaerolineales bacterium]|nr:ATP-binding protein [Anaerolineales bacterium]
MLVAGLLASILKISTSEKWGGQPPWQPAPMENSLEARFLRNIIPLSLFLALILMVGDWVIAGDAAREILQDRMASAAQIGAEGVPYFFDTGQSLILSLSQDIQPNLNATNGLKSLLQNEMRTVPFFRQLFVLDIDANTLGGYPLADFESVATSMDELAGIDLALSGVLLQTYTLPPMDGDSSAIVSFIAAIVDENDVVQGVLVGRTDIETNPFTQPILSSLASLENVNGSGYLLDENGRILYHPDPSRLQQTYPIHSIGSGDYYDETAPDGTRQISYYTQAVGRPWGVVITLPAHQFQKLALDIAMPLLGMVIILSIVAVGLIRLGLRTVTSSLKSLAVETDRIAQGQLDHALRVNGEDEVGQLRRSFEQMRVSLKDRLDELNRLLVVSQGVASSMEMEKAVHPILESALANGASSARIVLTQTEPGTTSEMPTRFGLGKLTKRFSFFDEQLLALMAEQDRIVLTNPARTTLLSYHPGVIRPESLLSIALHHENQYYGTLWIAYDTPHAFTKEEVSFLTTLAGQAALAAANTRLFWSAEFGRQRLAAILASTPDPVIVTDHDNQLLLVNPAALQAFDLDADIWVGKSIEKVIPQPELLSLLESPLEDKESIEVTLLDERIYFATASPILSDGRRIGTVCALRDVTHFKELDALKSEFVATVSHDLRSPLTLIRGYATMLEMVGPLNDQQVSYIRKIVTGVEGMARLINNLLDLGRIEAKIALKLEKLSVRDVIEQVTEAFRLQATQKHIKLKVDISELTTPLIEADQSMLEQAFHNLLENAIKYTPNGQEIWIRAKTREEIIAFEIQDTGIGISRVDIPRLFEKFYRSANREAKKQSGTGLGLAIVKSIVDRHGGRVWVESKLGKGSIFHFEVPIRQKTKVNPG